MIPAAYHTHHMYCTVVRKHIAAPGKATRGKRFARLRRQVNQRLPVATAAATAAAPAYILKMQVLKRQLTWTNISFLSASAARWRQAKTFALLSLISFIAWSCSSRAFRLMSTTCAASVASLALEQSPPSTAAVILGYI